MRVLVCVCVCVQCVRTCVSVPEEEIEERKEELARGSRSLNPFDDASRSPGWIAPVHRTGNKGEKGERWKLKRQPTIQLSRILVKFSLRPFSLYFFFFSFFARRASIYQLFARVVSRLSSNGVLPDLGLPSTFRRFTVDRSFWGFLLTFRLLLQSRCSFSKIQHLVFWSFQRISPSQWKQFRSSFLNTPRISSSQLSRLQFEVSTPFRINVRYAEVEINSTSTHCHLEADLIQQHPPGISHITRRCFDKSSTKT